MYEVLYTTKVGLSFLFKNFENERLFLFSVSISGYFQNSLKVVNNLLYYGHCFF